MTDIVATFLDRFEATLQQNQPAADISSRLQRIQELEQQRLEYSASRASTNTTETDPSSSRLSRREQIIRQATQPRPTERRSAMSTVSRLTSRSQSLDIPGPDAEETLRFRERFESSRQNLFGPRTSGSSESLVPGSSYSRHTDDTSMVSTVNDNTPTRAEKQFSDVGDILSSVRLEFELGLSSETNIAGRETRSSSMTRDIRSPSTNYQRYMMSNPSSTVTSSLSRTSSMRESSLREPRSRFRRRTIQGVDSNVQAALEIDRAGNGRPQPVPEDTDKKEIDLVQQSIVRSSSSSEITSRTVSSEESLMSGRYRASYRTARTVELCPDDTLPVLGFENEKVFFIDEKGHCHWLDQQHPLLRYIMGSNSLPDIILKPPKSESSGCVENEGVVASMEGDANARIAKLKELLNTSKSRSDGCEEGSNSENSDSVGFDCMDGEEISKFYDEKYKTISLYTPPRPRPNLDIYKSARTIFTVYDGIDMLDVEPECSRRQSLDMQLPVTTLESVNNNNNSSATQINASSIVTETSVTSQSVTNNLASRLQQAHVTENLITSQSVTNNLASHLQQARVTENLTSQSVTNNLASRLQQAHVTEVSLTSQSETNNLASRLQQARVTEASLTSRSVTNNLASRLQQARVTEASLTSQSVTSNLTSRLQQARVTEASLTSQSVTNNLTSRLQQARVTEASLTSQTLTKTLASHHQRAQVEIRNEPAFQNGDNNQQATYASSYREDVQRHSIAEMSPQTDGAEDVLTQYQLMHENTGIAVDTKHLDIEELRMIQKVLEENPSPPLSPVSVSSPLTQTQAEVSSPAYSTGGKSPGWQISEEEIVLDSHSVAKTIADVASPASSPSSSPTRRLSSSSSERKLQLPSMDFSPLQKNQQNEQFSFSPAKTAEVLDSFEEHWERTQETLRRESDTEKHFNELTIQIPDRSESNQVLTNHSDSNKSDTDSDRNSKSSVSPLVKSSNDSAALSPAGSETVSMVFEEFATTVSEELLTSKSQTDTK